MTVVSDDEAPVSAQWNDEPPPCASSTSAWNVVPGAEVSHVRFNGGNYWRPLSVLASLGENRGDPVSAISFASAVREGRHKSGLPLVALKGNRYGRDTEYFEALTVSDRAIAIQSVQNALDDLLVVDGIVYERCLEPMIVLKSATFDVRWHGRNAVTVAKALRITTEPPSSFEMEHAELFPIHKFREALGKARRAAASSNQLREVLNQSNSAKAPEIFSDYFRDPANAPASECVIKLRQFLAILDSKREQKLPFSNREKIRLICDMGDTLDALPDEAAFDSVEALGNRYLELFEDKREWLCPEQTILKQAIVAAAMRPVNLAIHSKDDTIGSRGWRP